MKGRVEIRYCVGCRWLLRAAWMAQELLTTFEDEIEALTLRPGTGGVFEVRVDDALIWSREEEGRFPDIKELKQRVRDRVAPGRSLGHTDASGADSNHDSEPGDAGANSGPDAVLDFWLGDDMTSATAVAARAAMWFGRDPDLDREIERRFGHLPDQGRAGRLERWESSPRTALALVIALDQFPRNLYRGRARAFAYDETARGVARRAIERGFDRELSAVESMFFYLPFEHAEDPQVQAESVACFERLAERTPAELEPQVRTFIDYARRHQRVIDRFGRFPHRNEALGRASTPEEEVYLRDGGDTF